MNEPITDWEESADQTIPGVPPPTPSEVEPQAQIAQSDTNSADPEAVSTESGPESQESDDRDEQGRFRKGGRHRARSQQARPEDVPRIRELTRQLREREAELQRYRNGDSTSSTPAPVDRRAPEPQAAAAEAPRPAPVRMPPPARRAPQPFTDPAPVEDDPKFGGDYGKYLEARQEYITRKVYADQRRADYEAEEAARAEADQRTLLHNFAGRVQAARAKYPDFETVAFGPTRIPAGSPIDAFIMEDDNGAEVLYHLQSNPGELDSLLGLSVLQQVKALALLSQRLSSTRAQVAPTGSTASRASVTPAPRPPNPVRTSPMVTPTDRPSDEDSLEAHEAFYYRRGRR